MSRKFDRRSLLRGIMGGAGVSVALPFLDCFLDDNGQALAATGEQLPVGFGTWFQALGLTPGRWIPEKTGPDYEHNVELKVFDPFRDRMNVISGTQYFLDGRPLETHTTGVQIATQGMIPLGVDSPATIDSIIADVIGNTTRFRSLEVSFSGSQRSVSKRAGSARNPSEMSPVALYQRIFGEEFTDPNNAEFTPSPAIMARRSVLSLVADDRKSLVKQVGAADRVRLDEYFTSVRHIEQQLDIMLQKPAPLASCSIPFTPDEEVPSENPQTMGKNIELFGALIAHAFACDQTRVFNTMLGSVGLRLPGGVRSWHALTHEEPIDQALGYQKDVTWFINWSNEQFVNFLRQLDSMREGPGSVLDRIVVLWQTDHGYARTHSMDNLPIFTVGSANGRIRTGLHVRPQGDPATRVGLTVQQALGVPVYSWGELSNETTKTITEIIA